MPRTTYNAPMFIYSILYDRKPPFIPGRTSNHPQKMFKGILVDKQIPEKALIKIFLIGDIITRASCQGESDIKPTFLIFRPTNQNKKYIDKFVSKLNKFEDIKAGYDQGREGFYRIGVTTNLWHDDNPTLFRQWWNKLPDRIQTSL